MFHPPRHPEPRLPFFRRRWDDADADWPDPALGPSRDWAAAADRDRVFARGDLKYVILDLLKDQPRHGYDVIRALEERFRGFYRPSPGSVYPTLQLLEDLGYVTATEQEGKRVYAITDAGRAFLAEQQSALDDIRGRLRREWGANREETRALMHEMRELGRVLFHNFRAGRLHDPERVHKLREIVARTRTEIEAVFEESPSPPPRASPTHDPDGSHRTGESGQGSGSAVPGSREWRPSPPKPEPDPGTMLPCRRVWAVPLTRGASGFRATREQVDWPRFLDEVAQAGYEWIELGPYGYLPTDPARLRPELEARGLRVAGGTVGGPLHHADAASARSSKQALRVAELTAAMGGTTLVLLPGGYRGNDGARGRAAQPRQATPGQVLIDNTNAVGHTVVDRFPDLTVAFHPHGDSHVETPAQVEAFLADTDPAVVGAVPRHRPLRLSLWRQRST